VGEWPQQIVVEGGGKGSGRGKDIPLLGKWIGGTKSVCAIVSGLDLTRGGPGRWGRLERTCGGGGLSGGKGGHVEKKKGVNVQLGLWKEAWRGFDARSR